MLRARMVRIHFEVDGSAPVLVGDIQGSQEERPPDAATAMLGQDVELVEPGNETTVLDQGLRQEAKGPSLRASLFRGTRPQGTVRAEGIMTGDERQIRELIEKWMKASSAGDTATVLELMADDVLFLNVGQKPFGKQEFAETNKEMKDVKLDAKSQIRELQIAGDWAWCRSDVDVTATLPDGKPVRRAGPVLTIFRKKPDGGWVLARDANLLAVVGR